MIAGCPRCGTRYRIAREQIRPEGVRLRCQRCQAAFRVRAPALPAASAVAAEAPGPPADRERLVVLADPDPTRAKATAAALRAGGLEVVLAHDGVEAILTIQRVLPRAVILDASLPKMFGFQICELMKRNQSLREIGVLLVGSVHRPGRYRRPPADLYGADAYLEEPDVAQAALAELRRLGVPVATPAPGATATPRPAEPETTSLATPQARPGPAPSAAGPRETPTPARVPESEADRPTREAVAKAERLARIIVSDIVLYNEEKFASALAAGNVLEALEAELEEGRALFRGRVEASVRETRDFLSEELLRVARSRGAK